MSKPRCNLMRRLADLRDSRKAFLAKPSPTIFIPTLCALAPEKRQTHQETFKKARSNIRHHLDRAHFTRPREERVCPGDMVEPRQGLSLPRPGAGLLLLQ